MIYQASKGLLYLFMKSFSFLAQTYMMPSIVVLLPAVSELKHFVQLLCVNLSVNTTCNWQHNQWKEPTKWQTSATLRILHLNKVSAQTNSFLKFVALYIQNQQPSMKRAQLFLSWGHTKNCAWFLLCMPTYCPRIGESIKCYMTYYL